MILDFNYWGIAFIALLLGISICVFMLIDKRSLGRVLKVFGLMLCQIFLLASGIWCVYRVNSWWCDMLWLAMLVVLAVLWCLYKMRWQWRKMALPVSASMIAGCIIGSSALLCLSLKSFVAVFGFLVSFLVLSVIQTLLTYERSLLHTKEHRLYLLANGATTMETIVPNVRRALRAAIQPLLTTMAQPLLVAMPLSFLGMLLGGVSPLLSALVLVLLVAVSFVSSVGAAITALVVYAKLNRQ